MDITGVEISINTSHKSKIQAFCSVVFDNVLVVHDIKVITEINGLHVAMPRKEFTKSCLRCNHKNPIRANFCNECGVRLPAGEPIIDVNGHVKRGKEVAYAINDDLSRLIHQKVLKAYLDKVNKNPAEGIFA